MSRMHDFLNREIRVTYRFFLILLGVYIALALIWPKGPAIVYILSGLVTGFAVAKWEQFHG